MMSSKIVYDGSIIDFESDLVHIANLGLAASKAKGEKELMQRASEVRAKINHILSKTNPETQGDEVE